MKLLLQRGRGWLALGGPPQERGVAVRAVPASEERKCSVRVAAPAQAPLVGLEPANTQGRSSAVEEILA